MNKLNRAMRNHRGAVRRWALGAASILGALLVLWGTTGQAVGVAAPDSQVGVLGQAATEVKPVIAVSAVRAISKSAPRDATVQEAVAEGVVNKEGTRFYVGPLPVVQGTTGALQLALENRSDQKVLAKIEVAGLSPTTEVEVVAAPGHNELTVVRIGPTTFVAEISGALTAAGPNLEVQWTPGLAAPLGSYPVQVTIQPVAE